MATDYHAEHVGSLLRQPWLLTARAEHRQGRLSDADLRAAEDRAVGENIALQREAGIEVFTDGEARRTNWMTNILESTGGVSVVETQAVTWRRDSGEEPPIDETDFVMTAATSKVFRENRLTNVEAEYMARHVPGQFKITMMSAAMGGILWRPDVSAGAYPDPAELVNDLVALQIEEIADLVARGTRWVQLDSLSYNQVFDADFRAATGNLLDPEIILQASVAADAAIVRAVKDKHPGVTVGMHICRGNNRSAYMAKGGYEPVAERLFGGVDVDRFLLEYDTDRAGGFEPLRFVRPGTVVVLGLISSKVPELESQDGLRRRIDEAARYVPLEDLAISPQCGFASTSAGNVLTVDEEKRKLELVADTAQRVWG
ncbi:5-methyltetrahydropteroyltriglutamate--homocysteine S-methyltransferase [Trebonia sp.]|uniref:5-methyltetrahydropteroyltriglutamate-- homocysteine S-methyltransferase n=1 Tax=Trebonia sp. TaxID=2767075 RepID=UPI00261B8A75|nr:5-methyltetrahydropteroyltriglutamate--homocysteine S-methyltransferase [Trebonia sp.]